MILDKLENSSSYYINENIKKGFEYLKNTDLSKLEVGKYEIDGDNVFVLIQEYETKPVEEGKWESHKKYLDIQYIISGHELMGYASIDMLTDANDFTPEKDIIYYKDSKHRGNIVRLCTGDFALFLPQDGHMPNIIDSIARKNKKAVVKVIVD